MENNLYLCSGKKGFWLSVQFFRFKGKRGATAKMKQKSQWAYTDF
jgi:hypothetical protein